MSFFRNKEDGFSCEICNKTFTRKDSLTRHLVLHTGNFKWYCDICEKGYNQKENYEKHIRVHKGLKYRCEYCSKAFSRSTNLQKICWSIDKLESWENC